VDQIQTILQPMMNWAINRWGFIKLAQDCQDYLVIKTADSRCENWLTTGIRPNSPYNPKKVWMTTFDTISYKTVKEYQVDLFGKGEMDATNFGELDRVADVQSKDASETEYCPKCGSHKAIMYSQGRPMKSCSNYFVCSGKEVEKEKLHPLKPLTTAQQQHFLREGVILELPKVVPQTPTDTNKQNLTGRPPTVEALTDDPQSGIGLSLVPDAELVPTSSYKLLKYPFSHFNRVQSTLLINNIHKDDVNLVLGTATSSGKTVCAELCMARTLARGGKVVYVSPLRALTQEKYDEWSETFGDDYQIAIMTGDHVLTDARANVVNDAHILCVTSEMLDSRTRKYGSDKSSWIDDVRLVVVDESHIIGTERGHAVEAGLMRLTRINQAARVLLMSATMPNVMDFAKWLTALNAKKTEVINSPWRPTPLSWHFPRYAETGDYSANRTAKIDEAIRHVTDPDKDHEKFLLFVHDKNTGNELLRKVRAEGIKSEFHNAGASKEVRDRIESEFKDPLGELRVLIATSTLAWGVNVPAQNAVIVGTTRGINSVDMADILQMAGRAGRALPPEYYIVAPDIDAYVQTSFDRLSVRLHGSVDQLNTKLATVIEVDASDLIDPPTIVVETATPVETKTVRRRRVRVTESTPVKKEVESGIKKRPRRQRVSELVAETPTNTVTETPPRKRLRRQRVSESVVVQEIVSEKPTRKRRERNH
jgi:superfamily II DNA/RNA helicase